MTQYQKIIKLLREAGEEGINSFDTRAVALQLPARIFYLKRPPYGLNIVTRGNKDSSVNYILIENAKAEKPFKWEFRGTTAIKIYL